MTPRILYANITSLPVLVNDHISMLGKYMKMRYISVWLISIHFTRSAPICGYHNNAPIRLWCLKCIELRYSNDWQLHYCALMRSWVVSISLGGRRGDRRPVEARGAHGGAVRRDIGVAAEDEVRYRGWETWYGCVYMSVCMSVCM